MSRIESTISFEGPGRELLDALVTKTIDSLAYMPEHNQYASKLGFTDTTLLNSDQKFGKVAFGGGARNVAETGKGNLRALNNMAKKGIYQQEVKEEYRLSYLSTQWLRNNKSLAGASDTILADMARVPKLIQDLNASVDIRNAEEIVKVLAKGFSITSPEGPGSATPKGLSLINASHTIDAGGTFSNIVTGNPYASVSAGVTILQSALDKAKAAKDENGKKIKQPKVYTLAVSRERNTFWRQVLNNKGSASAIGTNQGVVNQFNFEGNMVQLEDLDLLGDTDVNGVTIGSTDNAFLLNMEYLKSAEALKTYRLYEPKVKILEDADTDELVISIRAVVGADHYYAEYGVVGIVGA